MNYILMLAVVVGVSLQDMLRKKLSLLPEQAAGLAEGYKFWLSASAFLCHVLLSGRTMQGHLPSMLYGACFALGFTTAIGGSTAAVACGPVSLTALFSSFGLVIPTLYGILFLGESLSPLSAVGLAALCCSLVLVNWPKGDQEPVNKRWLFFSVLAFLGNGCCSLVQKLHQTAYPGQYAGDLMISGMLLVTLINLFFFLRKSGQNRKKPLALSAPLGAPAGLFNGLVNFGMVYLSARLPASLLYPTVSAGGIALSWLVVRLLYHERLSMLKQIGFFLGFSAVILMNLG